MITGKIQLNGPTVKRNQKLTKIREAVLSMRIRPSGSLMLSKHWKSFTYDAMEMLKKL